MVGEIAVEHRPEPFPLLREGRVQMLSQRCLDLMEFSSHAISPGLALEGTSKNLDSPTLDKITSF